MPHKSSTSKRPSGKRKTESRYTVALDRAVAQQVTRYAETTDTSLSKAISSLVLMGLESQEIRKREFFKRLKENLANDYNIYVFHGTDGDERCGLE